MGVSFKREVLASVILTTVAISAGQTAVMKTQAVVSLAISPMKSSVQSGSRILIKVVLTNISNHDIVVVREVSGTDCKVDVRDMAGTLASDTKYGRLWNGHAAVTDRSSISPNDLKGALVDLAVKQGQTLTWYLNVARLYDMIKPAQYTIYLERADPENSSVVVKSNVIKVMVTP